jgi:non-heme chloroperoxidase
MGLVAVENGVNLYYEDYGSGEPIVFIHGGGTSHEMWEQQVYALTDEFRTVVYDQRAHGQSDKPGHGYTFERLADDLEALLQHCEISRCLLVCHGIGVYVGLTLALKLPDRVRGLALAGGGARFLGTEGERGGFSPERWQAYIQGMARNKVEATAKLVNDGFYYRDPGAATRQAVIDTMLQWPLYATKMLGQALQNTDLGSRVSGLRVPTLILHGVHDQKQPFKDAQLLAERLPNSRLIPFEESAHNPQLEELEKFNQVITDFMRATSA